MRLIWRRSVTLLALYAVALHVIVLGFFPVSPSAFGPTSPFAIICHTTGPAVESNMPPPGTLHYRPGSAIEYCDLCCAAAPPPAPETALHIEYRPVRVLHVLSSDSTPTQSSLPFNSRLIRGPPRASA